MRPGPVVRALRGGLTRRRVQTIVIGLVVLVSTAASVLALALVVDSSAPFDHAFAAQRGAHLAATVDSARVTPAELASARRLPEVTAAAGPFPVVSATLQETLTPSAGRRRRASGTRSGAGGPAAGHQRDRHAGRPRIAGRPGR